MRSYIDANVIVSAYSSTPETEACRSQLNNGNLATGSVAVVEAWQALLNIIGPCLANKAVIDLLRRDVEVIALDASLIHDAVKHQEKCKLDAFDTLHLIAARQAKCSEILTFDKDILRSSTEIPARKL